MVVANPVLAIPLLSGTPSKIAEALGVTKQAVHKRHAKSINEVKLQYKENDDV